MENVKLWDKTFVPFISSDEIAEAIRRQAEEMNRIYCEYKDASDKAPIFISLLNGAYVFTADMLRAVDFRCELSFIKVASYEGTSSTGKIRELIGLNVDIAGRDVIVIDDIIDSGHTMIDIKAKLLAMNPKSVRVSSLIYKAHCCDKSLTVDFPCITMTRDAFIVGYGLDYDQLGRELKDIYILGE